MSRLSLSEPELLSASSESRSLQRRDRTRHGSDQTGGGGGAGGVAGTSNPARRSIGENWLLQEDPSYAVHRVGASLEEGLELEVSIRDESESGGEERGGGRSEGDGGACALINDHAKDVEENARSTTSPALSTSVSHLSREQENAKVPSSSSSSSSSSVSSTSSNTSASTSPSDPNGQEAFSLRHAVYANQSNSQSQSIPGTTGAAVTAPSQESVIKSLNREKVAALAGHLGLPPGLVPCLELEVARLQLGVTIFRHKSIRCDRGCEGDDDEDESGTTTGSTSSSTFIFACGAGRSPPQDQEPLFRTIKVKKLQ